MVIDSWVPKHMFPSFRATPFPCEPGSSPITGRLAGLISAVGLATLLGATCPAMAQTSATGAPTGATANFAPNDPPGEWHSQARDYANTRYSMLDQIKPENVGQLRVAWTFSDGTIYGHEGAPWWSGIRCMW